MGSRNYWNAYVGCMPGVPHSPFDNSGRANQGPRLIHTLSLKLHHVIGISRYDINMLRFTEYARIYLVLLILSGYVYFTAIIMPVLGVSLALPVHHVPPLWIISCDKQLYFTWMYTVLPALQLCLITTSSAKLPPNKLIDT